MFDDDPWLDIAHPDIEQVKNTRESILVWDGSEYVVVNWTTDGRRNVYYTTVTTARETGWLATAHGEDEYDWIMVHPIKWQRITFVNNPVLLK